MMNKDIRQFLAVLSILFGGMAIGIPETLCVSTIPLSKLLMAISTSLNAASLYLLKEELPVIIKETKEITPIVNNK